MATTTTPPNPPPTSSDPTFRHYAPSQAHAYATNRHAYHSNLFNHILTHHQATGGTLGTLLDVGCGPGNSTRPLARHFAHAYGIDPGKEMIEVARGISAEAVERGEVETGRGEAVVFVEGTAEELEGPWREEDGGRKVDLLTASTAAHWFDLPRFYASAAQVLNKGGTIAFWTSARFYAHPSMKNAARLQEAMLRLELDVLGPYELPGNKMCREAYRTLPLPWTIDPPIEGFSEAGFTRHDWDEDGKLSDSEHFFLGNYTITLAQLQKSIGTASMVTRWKEAHPELVGTEEDVLVKAIKEFRVIIGGEELTVGLDCHLLMLKRD